MKILFLTNLFPYPLDNGGKIKTYTTCQALYDGGHEIDLLCFYEDVISEEWKKNVGQFCRSFECIHTKLTTRGNLYYMLIKAFLSIFSQMSFGLYKYKNVNMKRAIKQMLSKNKYDIVYYDHLQMCVYDKYIKRKKADVKYILDEHNCEYILMKRHYENAANFIKKLFLKLEYMKLRNFEAKMLCNVDNVIVLSKEDKQQLDVISKKSFMCDIIPIGVKEGTLKDVLQKNEEKIRLLFLGTMTWEPNRLGLLWFMRNVIPQLEQKKIAYTLDIVGKNPGDEIEKIAERYESINVAGYVDSTEEYFSKCDVMIVPLFVGSGQRVKILEAFSKGFPVISTMIGAEGLDYIDGENILIADTKEQFVEAILKLHDGERYRKIAENSRMLYDDKYSYASVKRRLLNSVNNINRQKQIGEK